MSISPAGDLEAWTATVDRALPQANIPTLLMVLVHLTGDLKWIDPRFACKRVQGLDEDGTGGLSEDARAEILAAAREAILAHKAGTPAALPLPNEAVLQQMILLNTGERVPESYGAMIAGQLDDAPNALARAAIPEGFSVAIIGGGIGGLCLAIQLQRAGVAYTVFEKNPTIGGTWHENRYPGCGVDTPSHIYSFSFAKHDWSMHFALQPEIQAYFEGVTDAEGVRPNVRFESKVTSARYDEAARRWVMQIEGADGATYTHTANILVSAVGYLNTPRLPDIEGLDTFEGPVFHTARWPEDLDVTGRDVAVIGNGATAMQVVPEIAPKVASVTVFQRSKQWAAPFAQFRQDIPEAQRFLLREVPFYQEWYRQRLLWIFNDRIHGALQIDPEWPHPERAVSAQNDRHRAFFTEYVKSELGERQDLLPEVLPDYPPFGKRMLMDNRWYRTVARDNVHLVSDSVARVEGRTIVTASGERRDADILVVATGFDAVNMLASFDLTGRGGLSIRDAWAERGPEAYMGLSTPGFPNFFMLSGPNTGLGHGGSAVALIENQVRSLMDLVGQALESHGPDLEIEVRPEVNAAYNVRVQDAHDRMIWSHKGMRNWYVNDKGRVVVNTPFRNDQNWREARGVGLEAFVINGGRTEPA